MNCRRADHPPRQFRPYGVSDPAPLTRAVSRLRESPPLGLTCGVGSSVEYFGAVARFALVSGRTLPLGTVGIETH